MNTRVLSRPSLKAIIQYLSEQESVPCTALVPAFFRRIVAHTILWGFLCVKSSVNSQLHVNNQAETETKMQVVYFQCHFKL